MLLTSLFERRQVSLGTFDEWLDRAFEGQPSATGTWVGPEVAMGVTAVYAAVRLLAETVASLPLIVYKRLPDGGKQRDPDHPLSEILGLLPNRWQTSFEYREMMMGHLVLRGNAYGAIIPGAPISEIIPLHPDRVKPKFIDGRIIYVHRPDKGGERIYLDEEIFHVKGLSSNLLKGLSPLAIAREAIAVAISTQEYGARFFGNDARPGGVLQTPHTLEEPERENLKTSWEAAHRGTARSHKVAVLEHGMEWKQIGLTGAEAQLLESRKFQISEIARIFNVPAHMLKDLDRATFSNIEHLSLEFIMYSLLPWLRRWEQAIHRSLMGAETRKTHFVEFLLDGLLRGDRAARFDSYTKGIQWGILSPNEVRRLENMNPRPGGDVYLQPLNMIPSGSSMADADRNVRLALHDVIESMGLPGGPSGPALPIASEKKTLSPAATRSLTARRRLRDAFAPIFAEASRRLIRFETTRVRQSVKKFLGERTVTQFSEWVTEFYGDEGDLVERAAGTLRAPIVTYFEAIQIEGADEVGADPGMTPELEQFTERYVEAFAARHAQASRVQLEELVDTTLTEELAEKMGTRLDEWDETRPAQIAHRETVQGGSALVRAVYMAAGTVSLIWVAGGNACPLCAELDGKVIGIQSSFVDAGGTVDPDDGVTAPLTAGYNVRHPQLHGGCECDIVAG
ncbi:MAG: phage portal protein [bacterium]|nr:phage portal protein [bacterium]